MDPCTFTDTETPSIGPYPSREGHRSFYPQTPAHLRTQKLRPLAHIPPGRGTGVFIHGPLHIYGHGHSVHWPVSLQGGAPEFYPRTPAHFQTQKLCPLACIPPGRGTGVFIHGSLHIYGHGNSICWPVYLQGGAPEFLSTDPCTFKDMKTPSIGLYPFRQGHRSFYLQIPAHLWTWKLHPLACIPPGRGTRVFICRSLHISRHGNSVHWPISLQGGALEHLSLNPCTFPNTSVQSINNFFGK